MNRLSSLLKTLLRSRQHKALCLRAAQELMAQRLFSYVRVGHDQRTIELLAGHRIGRGADEHERQWRIEYRRGGPCLFITGVRGVTCILHPQEHGRWQGRWQRYEKMDILLKPAAPAGARQPVSVPPFFSSAGVRAYTILQRYRRTVASNPRDKKLIAVASDLDAPLPFGRAAGRLSDEALFFKLQDSAGSFYWSKLYHADQHKQLPLELALYEQLAHLKIAGVMLPVDYRDDLGLVFDYDPELFDGAVVHADHARAHFSPEHAAAILGLAETELHHPVLGRLALGELCDFQTVLTSHGLVHIDFMLRPRHWWNL